MRKDKSVLAVLFAAVAMLVPASVIVSSGLIHKSRAVNEMNRRRVEWDTDGHFAMVSIKWQHIGLYSGNTVLAHFWAEDLRRVPPGYYILSICEDWIELCADKTDTVYIIRLEPHEIDYIKDHVSDLIPVVVY